MKRFLSGTIFATLAVVVAAGPLACSSSSDSDSSGGSTGGGGGPGGVAASGGQSDGGLSDASAWHPGNSGGGGNSASGGSSAGGGGNAGTSDGGGDSGNQGAVGATTPFARWEAEDGTIGGGATKHALTAPPADKYASPELEASGHAYVSLDNSGNYVEWTNNTGKNITFINVRASIPDADNGTVDGVGRTATLDLLVNGTVRQQITLTSTQTWIYEGTNYNGNEDQVPTDGRPRNFWDDAHAFITGAPVGPGQTIRLQKNAGNGAAFYHIDVVDVEDPPAPLTQPANALSLTTDCHATADNDTDATLLDNYTKIQACLALAKTNGKSIWIPQGTFYFRDTHGFDAYDITIEGAGMWYSRVYRKTVLPNVNGSLQPIGMGAVFNVRSCKVRNFAVDSNATSRAQKDGCAGAMDTAGINWEANGIWIQHTMSGFWASGEGGIVHNCRITSVFADGCNINNVSLEGQGGTNTGSNITVENNFVRGTGDDGFAINSVDWNNTPTHTYAAMASCKVQNNTAIAPWGGKGVAVYGGGGHVVQNNYMSDTARYIGLGVGKFGANGSNLTSATVSGNVVVRCGGNAYDQRQPALHIGNGGDGQSVGTVSGALVKNNTVLNALYNGVGFSTSSNTTLDSNTIDHPGLNGIVIAPDFYPAPTGSAMITNDIVKNLMTGNQAFINNSAEFAVTQSGNNW